MRLSDSKLVSFIRLQGPGIVSLKLVLEYGILYFLVLSRKKSLFDKIHGKRAVFGRILYLRLERGHFP